MSRRALFASPTIARLQTVIESIRAGELLFPGFLRPLVWTDAQRLRLLDSIVKGLPIGSLLVWRTQVVSIRHETRVGPITMPPPSPHTLQHEYVLDGVQRLATLYTTLAGPASPQTDDAGRHWPIYFDLERDIEAGDEDRFMILSRGVDVPATWLPLAALFDIRLRWGHQQRLLALGRDDLANKVEHLDRVFKDYALTLVPLVTDDFDIAITSFQRINTEGTRMGQPDMLRALTYRHDFDVDLVFSGIIERLPWPDISRDLLVRTLEVISGLAPHEASLAELADSLDEDRTLVEKLEHALAMSLAFLSRRCRIMSRAALPHSMALVALANAASRGFDLTADGVAPRLETWLWATAYTEYFRRKTGAQLTRAFSHVLHICGGSDPLPADLPRSCAPLTRFDARSGRSLMLMHLLARQPLIDERRVSIDGSRLVARGRRAFAKLFLEAGADDPANRILVDPLDAASLRTALGDRAHPHAAELRDAHVLPPWNERGAEDRHHVLDWRRGRLRELEAADLTRLGLQVEEVPGDG
jgi:hypothetical protein